MVIFQNTNQIIQLSKSKDIQIIVRKKTKREDNAGYIKDWQKKNLQTFRYSQKKYDKSQKGIERHRRAQARYKRKLKKKEAHRLRNLKFRLNNPNYWKDWNKKNPTKMSQYQSRYNKTEKGIQRHRKAQAKYITTPKGKESIKRKKQNKPIQKILVVQQLHN